ncbi:MAG: type IV pilus secretin PilQ [Deltaproteobacteria bacterium]|nr:type IV pilus secretin PilQ [Deltaproteobacteria bacterium]
MSVPFMRYREVHWTRLWPLLVVICLAMGLYSCSAKKVGSRPSQEPAMGSAESAQQAEAPPMDRKPMESAAAVGEATLEGSFQLQELRVFEGMAQTTLRIRFSQPVTQFRHFTLSIPTRVVLDVFGDVKQMAEEENFHVGTGWVNDLKLSTGKGYFRLVAQINAGTVPHFTVQPDDNGLSVVIGPINRKISTKKDLLLIQGGRRVMIARGPSTSQASQASSTGQVRSPQAAREKKEYTGQKISLDFKDADIKNVFRLLAEISGLNIVVTDDVNKKVTVRLVDIPWDQAMDILLQTNGLGKEQVGNVVRISTVQRLRSERDAIKVAQDAEKALEPLHTDYLTVNYAKASEIVEKVKAAGVLTGRGRAIADDRSNLIFIRDIRRAVDEANDIVSRLDTRTPQVLIESNIIETTPSFARALGMNFDIGGLIKGDPDRTITAASRAQAQDPFSNALGLPFSVLQARWGSLRNINAVLTAAEEEGNVRIVSRPSVVTLNNVTSTIQSLRIVRIELPTGTTNIASGSGSAAGAAVATESVSIGIILSVTPQVSSDGFILMNISVKSSSLAAETSGDSIPDELSREAISNVLVRDGDTVVIGGIMKDTREESESGVPYLKDIPVLGWLFKRIRLSQDFEELMVFITPRVIMAGAADLPSAEQLWRNSLQKTEGNQPLIPRGPVGP